MGIPLNRLGPPRPGRIRGVGGGHEGKRLTSHGAEVFSWYYGMGCRTMPIWVSATLKA